MRKLFISFILLSVCLLSDAQTKEVVAVLGDSYSTYEDYLTPDTNAIWYFKKEDKKRTDVVDVKQTWWWQVIKDGGYKLGVNNSFSGATICYSGYNDEDYSGRSFVRRLTNLGTPDIIFIFGGTNDSWSGAPVGEFKYSDFKRADLYTFRPAMAYMMQELQNRYPNVKLYFIANTELKDDITSSIHMICQHYGVKCIQLKDIDKQNGHPTIKGMKAISEQVLQAIKAEKL
jgi:lysophospholipase L1-like esterase